MNGFGRRTAIIILAAAALYLAGNNRVGLWDRDEPRYAQTSKQMLESDPPNWVVPMLLDQVRTAKPIFIYWCQAASMRFLGGATPFAARLPSAVAMVLVLGILAAVLRRSVGPRRAMWTILILSTSALAIVAAKMCITDAVLLLWITIAQLCLFAIYRGNRSATVPTVMWIAIGLAGLTKGPVVLGVQITSLLVLSAFDGRTDRGARVRRATICWWRRLRSRAVSWPDAKLLLSAWVELTRGWLRACLVSMRWLRHTRPLLGLFILILIVGPWLAAIEMKQPGFLKQTLLHDVFARTVKPLEGHKGPPGYYLLTIWGTFMPWSLLLPTAFTIAWKHRRLAEIRFALAAIIGPWVMFELVQTKLVHYVLPVFPPLAFLTADALVRCIRGQHDDLRRPIAVVVTAIWAIAVAALGFVPWLAVRLFGPFPAELYIIMTVVAAVGVIYAMLVFFQFRSGRLGPAMASMGGGMMVVIGLTYALYLPGAWFLWLPQRVGESLKQHHATTKGDVIMIDYKEDSLPFYQGGTIRQEDEDFFAKSRPEIWPRWVVITRDAWRKLPGNVTSRFDEVESFRGWAYAAKGRILDVLIMHKREPAPKPSSRPSTMP